MLTPRTAPTLALAGLWVRAASLAALAAYTTTNSGLGLWLPLVDLVASTVLLALWTPLMGRVLRGGVVLTTDPLRTAVSMLYPWVIAFEGTLWLLFTFLPAVAGVYPVNPVASTVQVTVSGVGILVSFLAYLWSVRFMVNPADTAGRSSLVDVANLAAALAAAQAVLTVVPLGGMPAQTLASQVLYAGANVIEAASWLLLRWALLSAARTERQD